jgi:hypothetical protein
MKRWILWIAVSISVFFLSGVVWANNSDSRNYNPTADSVNDPVLPGPKQRGQAEGLGVGSLIDSAVMATPPEIPGIGGKIVVWGYRFNGHSGNYNWIQGYASGDRRGWEHGTYPSNFPLGRQMGSVRDFYQNPAHPLYSQKVIRLFTTGHTFFAMTEEGELWSWGDSLHGTAGCVNSGYETVQFGTITGMAATSNNAPFPKGPHYQARPCPVFGPHSGVPALRNKKVVYIDGGEYNVIAITDEGEVYTWGASSYGATTVYASGDGTGSIQNKTIPLNITHFFEGERVILVGGAYEGQYAVSVDKNGKYTLWGWGASRYESLSSGATSYIQVPKRLTQYDHLADKIIYVNGGYTWTAVLLSDGRVFGSGRMNVLGQGVSSGTQKTFNPVQILGPGTTHPAIIDRLIVRFAGGIAYSAQTPYAFYHWGRDNLVSENSLEWGLGQTYGYLPIKRDVPAGIKSLGATKYNIYYLDQQSRLFGYGRSNQRVLNLCGINTISYDKSQNGYHRGNMNWWRNNAIGGGYRIPYEIAVDAEDDYCAGKVAGGTYGDASKSDISEWTGYFDGTEGLGPRPSSPYRAGVCRFSTPGDC